MRFVSLFAGRGPGQKTAKPLISMFQVDESGCWIWQGRIEKNGYGRVYVGDEKVGVHRLFYETLVAEIPTGHQIDHLCKVRSCVNPNHLEAVSQYENNMRSDSPAAVNARKTSCPQGHPYDEINTGTWDRGNGRSMRYCRTCRRERHRARKEVMPNVS